MSPTQHLIRHDGEGEKLWFAGGGVFTMKASAADTAGTFMCFEDRVVRGETTPMHRHPGEDEALYVLEGELLVHVDGKETRVGKGGFVFAPRGVAHAFLVVSETAHLLCMQTPGSGEGFYRSASEPADEHNATQPPDIARLQRAAAQHARSIELLGPPPFAPLKSA